MNCKATLGVGESTLDVGEWGFGETTHWQNDRIPSKEQQCPPFQQKLPVYIGLNDLKIQIISSSMHCRFNLIIK